MSETVTRHFRLNYAICRWESEYCPDDLVVPELQLFETHKQSHEFAEANPWQTLPIVGSVKIVVIDGFPYAQVWNGKDGTKLIPLVEEA